MNFFFPSLQHFFNAKTQRPQRRKETKKLFFLSVFCAFASLRLYRNNLKNREFGKEAAEILESGASDIVREQGASEDPKFLPQPTPPKTDSSGCFGIYRVAILSLLFLTACGYRMERGEKVSISVPYVIGDHEGALTEALARAISRTANFQYAKDDGDWILQAKITKVNNDRIGYRYDRDDESGKRRDNIVGVENRKEILVEVSVVDAATDKLIAGPQVIKAYADYDYVDPNSLRDLSFIDPATGTRVTSIAFSLGQLDSVGSAGEDAIYPVYRILAQKIVDGLIAAGEQDGD